MNSLSDLNSYNSSTTFEYTENRVARVLFDRDTANNQALTVNEGATFTSPVGIEITDVVDYTTALPTYTINVSTLAGTTVSWPTVPSGCTVTNPSTGIYRIAGINTAAIWDLIKNPSIILSQQPPNGFYGTFTYTATVAYTDGETGAQTKSWTVAVVVQDVTILTNPTELTYSASSTFSITSPANIINLDTEYPSATWTVTLTPSPNTSVTSIQKTIANNSATFNFNSSTKVLTLSGPRSDVNNYLNALTMTVNSTQQDFIITYQATNNQDAAIDTKTQLFRNLDIAYLANPTSSIAYYTEDTLSDVDGTPLITDLTYVGAGNYTLTVTPSTASLVYTMSSTGSGGTSTFNGSTKILTLVGTKAEVNSHLGNLKIQTESDVDSTFTLTYAVTTPDANTATKIQQLICNSNDTEVSNLSVSRNYQSNYWNTIFASNTPQITDLDSTGTDTYTVVLNCSFGDWTYVDGTETALTNPLNITGDRSTVNSKIAGIKFYPDAGVYSNGTFTFTLIKNGVTTVNQTMILNGTNVAYGGARSFVITNSQTFTPDPLDVRYGQWDLVLVGGGGAAGYNTSASSLGGGGGGEVLEINNFAMAQQTYNLVIGAGGTVSTSPSPGSSTDGANTTGFGYTARGGKKGLWITNIAGDYTRTGGNSGEGNLGGIGRFYYPSGSYTPGTGSDPRYGGGGGGSAEGYTSSINLGVISSSSILGRRASKYSYTQDYTFTNVSLLNGSGSGAKATVYIQHVGGTLDWNSNCEITITDGGSGYNSTDVLTIDVSALLPLYQDGDDIRISSVPLGSFPQKAGKKGKLIQWSNSSTSIYGYYGGGGSAYDLYSSSPAGTGAIGNLVAFAALGRTQSNGISTDNTATAPANSGGGGSWISGSVYNAGSGIIGIRIR